MNLLSKIFKKDKIKDYEIISNPKILFDKNVVAEELKLNGHRIGNYVSVIDLSKIDMTGLEIYPQKIDFSSWREGKTYVTINGKEIEFTLEERKKAVIERGGWLGYENGARFRIENQTITSFSLHEKILTLFNKYSKSELKRLLGNNVKVELTYENYDGTLFRTEFKDLERGINIMWDEWDKKILLIAIEKKSTE